MGKRLRKAAGRRRTKPPAETPIEAVRRLLAAKGRHSLELGRELARLDPAERRALAKDPKEKGAGLSLRSIYYLTSVATAVDQGLITEEQVRQVGWSRARKLVEGVLTGRAKPVSEAALARARRTPARLLTYQDAAVAAAKPTLKTLTFAVTVAQAKAVEAALARFGTPARSASPGARAAALVAICKAAAEG